VCINFDMGNIHHHQNCENVNLMVIIVKTEGYLLIWPYRNSWRSFTMSDSRIEDLEINNGKI